MALSSTHHGFFKGISRYAGKKRWHLNSFMAYSGKIPLGWRGDGIISFCGYRNELADFIRRSPLPKVELTLVRDDLNAAQVAGNNIRIGDLAARYFLGRHFDHFAWAPFADDRPNRERLQGFSQTLQNHGKQLTGILTTAMVTSRQPQSVRWDINRRRLMAELKQLPKPAAIFAYNDGIGVEVISACLEAGLLVPEQVAVLGVDNDPIVCESSPVPLSSIQYDLAELAYQGAALLDKLMAGVQEPPYPILIDPGEVVTRMSTDILAVDHIEVARALRYIWSHLADPQLSVQTVAAQTSLTTRGLLKAFKEHLSRSIHDEITTVRMEKAAELLSGTSLTIAQIASRCGFVSVNNFHRAFRQYHKMTPGTFRHSDRPNHQSPKFQEQIQP